MGLVTVGCSMSIVCISIFKDFIHKTISELFHFHLIYYIHFFHYTGSRYIQTRKVPLFPLCVYVRMNMCGTCMDTHLGRSEVIIRCLPLGTICLSIGGSPVCLGWLASQLLHYRIFAFFHWNCIHVPPKLGFLHGCWETELRFLYLCGKFFTDWAISLARIRAPLRRFCSSYVNWSSFTHNLVSFLWCKIVSFFLGNYIQKYNPSFSMTRIKQKQKYTINKSQAIWNNRQEAISTLMSPIRCFKNDPLLSPCPAHTLHLQTLHMYSPIDL